MYEDNVNRPPKIVTFVPKRKERKDSEIERLRLSSNKLIGASEVSDGDDSQDDDHDSINDKNLYRVVLHNYEISLKKEPTLAEPDSRANSVRFQVQPPKRKAALNGENFCEEDELITET